MPILRLHQTQMKCGCQVRSEIPWLKCSEHPGSQQLSAGRSGCAEGHYYYYYYYHITISHRIPTVDSQMRMLLVNAAKNISPNPQDK